MTDSLTCGEISVCAADALPTSDPPAKLPGMEQEPAGDDPFDYGADADPDARDAIAAFAQLEQMCLQAERATEARKRAEEQLQKAKQLEDRLLTKDIPELLARLRMDKGTTKSGIDFAMRREIRASLPGHDRVEARAGAIRWLIANGHGGVVKNKVAVELDRGLDERAEQLATELRAKGFDVIAMKDVHPSTLSALAKELMEAGKVIPTGTFSLFDDRKVKLTRKS